MERTTDKSKSFVMISVSGIVICAGLSGRMDKFKPLLKLVDGKTFVQTIVEKLANVCGEIIVVTGYRSGDINENLASMVNQNSFRIVENKNYKAGMFSSLQFGLISSNAAWYLYHFVDQPGLPTDFYKKFVNQVDDEFNWIQPVKGERKGHPILFDKSVKEKILRSSVNNTLRDITKDDSIKKKYWQYDSELIFQDIDTEKEYQML